MAGHHHTEVVDFLRLAHDGEIAGITIEGDRLEAQIHKGLIHRLLPNLRSDTGGKVLQGGSHIDELAGFALLRLEEMAIHQLPFQIGHLEPTVTLTGGLTVLKPVLEALFVEVVSLKGVFSGDSRYSTLNASQRRVPVGSLRNFSLLPVPQNEAIWGRRSA